MRPARLAFLPLIALLGGGCGFTVQRQVVAAPVLPCTEMRSATAAELMAAYNRNAEAVQSLRLDIKILAKTGGRKTKIEETKPEVDNAHLLLQKPDMLRVYGCVSAGITCLDVFDLATQGSEFRLSIPHYSEFLQGRNDFIPEQVKSPWETLRPPIIIQALPVIAFPVDATHQLVALNERADTAALYSVLWARVDANGTIHGDRRLFFSRCDLLPRRQIEYDPAGNGGIATDVTYDRYLQVDGVYFPQLITLIRPAEDYSLQFTVKPGGVHVNPAFSVETFELTQPSGSKLVLVGPRE